MLYVYKIYMVLKEILSEKQPRETPVLKFYNNLGTKKERVVEPARQAT